jgi:hypothetical protein
LLTAGVDVQLTEKYLVISDPLIDSLRRLEIAAEWFRVAYRMNKDPRQNPHLYRQLAEMKRQIEALETEATVQLSEINTRAGERTAETNTTAGFALF